MESLLVATELGMNGCSKLKTCVAGLVFEAINKPVFAETFQ